LGTRAGLGGLVSGRGPTGKAMATAWQGRCRGRPGGSRPRGPGFVCRVVKHLKHSPQKAVTRGGGDRLDQARPVRGRGPGITGALGRVANGAGKSTADQGSFSAGAAGPRPVGPRPAARAGALGLRHGTPKRIRARWRVHAPRHDLPGPPDVLPPRTRVGHPYGAGCRGLAAPGPPRAPLGNGAGRNPLRPPSACMNGNAHTRQAGIDTYSHRPEAHG